MGIFDLVALGVVGYLVWSVFGAKVIAWAKTKITPTTTTTQTTTGTATTATPTDLQAVVNALVVLGAVSAVAADNSAKQAIEKLKSVAIQVQSNPPAATTTTPTTTSAAEVK